MRVSVPMGFFGRLISTCDFRAITQPFFSLNDLRPQSSECDPVLFFKILLLEYILDVGSDALRTEFTSNTELRAFLNIDSRTVLPAPGEITYFRRALGWMGFKSLLERVIREAIKNGLPERDCAILEKRYDNPLVEATEESPPDEYVAGVIPSSPPPFPEGVGLNSPDESEDLMPLLSNLNISELFERFIVPELPDPIQIVKSPGPAESTLHASGQMLRGGQPGTQEPRSDLGIKPTRPGISPEHGMSLSNSILQGDQESDPLGIESFFDGMHSVPPQKGSRSLGSSREQEGYAPPRQFGSKRPPSAPHHQALDLGGSSSRLQASFEETRTRKDRPSEGQDSSKVQLRHGAEENARGSAGRLQRIELTPEGRMGDQSWDAMSSEEKTPQTSPEHLVNFLQSTPGAREIIGPKGPFSVGQHQKPPFSTIGPPSRPDSPLSRESLLRSLYIAVPILVLLAVYMLIGILRQVQPGPSAVESAQPASSLQESNQKSTPGHVRQPQPAPTKSSDGSGIAVPAQSEQLSSPLQEDANPSPEAVQPAGTSVRSPIKGAEEFRSARVRDGVMEEPKKLALIRHLRLEHGLDFRPHSYTYRELKDIDDRLEEALKKAAR